MSLDPVAVRAVEEYQHAEQIASDLVNAWYRAKDGLGALEGRIRDALLDDRARSAGLPSAREDRCSNAAPTLPDGENTEVLTLRDQLAEAERARDAWRSWAQFVFNDGGPVTGTDDELRAAVSARYDREVEAMRVARDAAIDREMTYARERLEVIRQRDVAIQQIEAVWRDIKYRYDIEPREYFEREAPKNGFQFALVQALHHIWKREPKVEQLLQQIEMLRGIGREMRALADASSAMYQSGINLAQIRVWASQIEAALAGGAR